jgi:energy-coupling factor transporter ATP-binding protein EcfA2
LQKEFDFSIDPDAYVDSLTVGERQQLEILRLLWLGAQVLILDEPTTGISAPQKIKLFATLHRLAQEGKTIIFVSHKLEDVEQLCSRVAVLQRGKLVGEAEPPYNIDQLVTMMFGKAVTLGSRIICAHACQFRAKECPHAWKIAVVLASCSAHTVLSPKCFCGVLCVGDSRDAERGLLAVKHVFTLLMDMCVYEVQCALASAANTDSVRIFCFCAYVLERSVCV